MTDLQASPFGARRSSRRALPRVFGILLAVVLSLSIVAHDATPADANPAGAVFVAVGETLTAPAAEVTGTAVAGGGCIASLVCGAIVGGTFLAVAAYETRDSWLPTVKGLWNYAFSSNGSNTQGTTSLSWSPARSTTDAAAVRITLSWQNVWNDYVQVDQLNYACKSPAGLVTSSTNAEIHTQVTSIGSNGNGNGVWEVTLCSAGSTLVSMTGRGHVSVGCNFYTGVCTAASYGGFGDAIPDGQQSQKTTVTCRRPDGSTFTIAGSHTYGDRAYIPSCSAAVPGSIPTHVTVAAGWPGAEQTVADTALNDPHTQYPDCFDASGAYTGTCVVAVWINGNQCAVGVSGCGTWETYKQDHPNATVQCKWGSYVVAMSDCAPLSVAYQPNTGVQIINQTDPSTGTPTSTQTQQHNGGTQSQPAPGPALPTTGTNPSVGTGTNTPPNAQGQAVDTDNCLGNGWSWNPVSWIFTPVKCALIWAFVPATPLQNRIDTIKTTYASKFPFNIGGAFNGMSGSLTGGCPDWRIKVGNVDQNIVCDSSFVGAIRSARPWIAGGMLAVAFWPLIRGIFYASIPVLKPTPNDGGR